MVKFGGITTVITMEITGITSVLPLISTVLPVVYHQILPLTSTGIPLVIPRVNPETFSMGLCTGFNINYDG